MIEIDIWNNHQIFLKLSKSNYFRVELATIKKMLVREYLKSEELWIIPILDLPKFVKMCKSSNIKFTLSQSTMEIFYQTRKWYKYQLELRKNKIINEDIKQMNSYSKLELYDYQKIGSYFLYQAKRALLCDMVGLGKTPQSLVAIERVMSDKEINSCIIIAPNTLKRNWGGSETEMGEIEKFTGKKALVIGGTTKAKRKKQYQKIYEYDYIVLNYSLLAYDMDYIIKYILNSGLVFGLILDEVPYIKNHKAQRSKLVKEISLFAEYIYGLSATLIENSLLDLWSIMQVIDPTVLGDKNSYWNFADKVLLFDYFGSEILDIQAEKSKVEKTREKSLVTVKKNPMAFKAKKRIENADEKILIINQKIENRKYLKQKIKPYFIRRFKEDVFRQLPKRVENNYWVELLPNQMKVYNDIKNQVIGELNEMELKNQLNMSSVLTSLIHLRMCALSSSLMIENGGESAKIKVLHEIIQSLYPGTKLVVFCHFVDMVEEIYESLESKGIKTVGIHGEPSKKLYCPSDKRIETVNMFNKSTSYQVLLTSDILIEGVNITSAGYLINFDILFNPAKMEQRAGRIDRIGQKHSVINIINIIAENTVEEKMFEILQAKKSISDDIIDDNKKESRLTLKNIKNILEI